MDRNDIHFLTDEKGNSCFIAPLVQFGQFGTAGLENDKLPVLNIGYALEQLMPLARLFGEMMRVGAVPHMHIWSNEQMPSVEVAFEYRMPDRDVLLKILGERYIAEIDSIDQWDEIGAIACLRMHAEDTQRFLGLFKNTRKARVLVFEATQIAPPHGSTVAERNPVADFLVPIENLHRRKFRS
jgi:hypothetical protein